MVGACGSSGNTAAGPAARPAAATTISASYLLQVQAKVLVTGGGYALYMYLPDHQRAVTCSGLCAQSWPPLFAPAHGSVHTVGGAKSSLLGRDRDPAGGEVVTYNRWPLYTYAGDSQPGVAVGQGVNLDGGYWYVMQVDGTPLVPSGEPPATGTPADG